MHRAYTPCRTAQKRSALLRRDADEVLCTEDEDWVDKVKHITDGKGAYGAVDAVAGELTAKMVNAVRKDGTVLIYGALSGFTATVPVPDVLFQGKIVSPSLAVQAYHFAMLHARDASQRCGSLCSCSANFALSMCLAAYSPLRCCVVHAGEGLPAAALDRQLWGQAQASAGGRHGPPGAGRHPALQWQKLPTRPGVPASSG